MFLFVYSATDYCVPFQAIIHPDTNEKIFMPCRMSGKGYGLQCFCLGVLCLPYHIHYRVCTIWKCYCNRVVVA